MSYENLPWDPTIPNQPVRLINNPGRRGVTTGEVEHLGSRLRVLVNFGPNEETLKPYDKLELYSQEPETVKDLLAAGRFGKPGDLRQILTYEKIKGQLTNVFYSMEASKTDFYAYQFKPVIKFLESAVGRLLIADEVGLGKTIESTYIWKELQARQEARRLLIVCPSMLRDKWADDLKNLFNIEAEVLDAKRLLEKLQSLTQTGKPQSFIYIISYEGCRPSRYWSDPERTKSPRAELARLIHANPVNEQASNLFDLVIFDEAHKARNPETLTNKLISLVCEASPHAVLLTATPIQTQTDNLFQLLKLVSPDDFSTAFNFENMLRSNKPIVEAQSLIWKNQSTENCPDPIAAAREAIEQALESDYFAGSSRLKQVYQDLITLGKGIILQPEIRSRIAEVLESISLFGQFMTRTRKRDVMRRVIRDATPVAIEFSIPERSIYEHVTTRIRKMARGRDRMVVFSLIMRQRQMASSLVAALEAWKKKDTEDVESYLWEDFGLLASDKEIKTFRETHATWSLEITVNIPQLEAADTKYKKLRNSIKQRLKDYPDEKFVLFSFFKGTLAYLKRRLEVDGIFCEMIAGGQSRQERKDILQRFKENRDCNVLLSTEVGSEGIDLQFCRVLINYDLPWNPMRVEQRIGRIDRLGQASEKISIINFYCQDSIEDRILERLYERIRIFEESIGDIEEILGEETEKILQEVIKSNLSDQQREAKAQQEVEAIARQIEQQRKLENEAINMVAFSDYILNSIDKSRKQGRWLRPEDLEAFVNNFFQVKYPGTVIDPKPKQPHVFEIKLSPEAKTDLQLFCNKYKPSTRTVLYQGLQRPITCFFDPKIAGTVGNLDWELLDPMHPLIKWICHDYEIQQTTFQPVAATRLSQDQVTTLSLDAGIYVYAIHYWSFEGLRQERRLAYRAIHLDKNTILTDDHAETLIATTMTAGQQRPNAKNLIQDFDAVIEAFNLCDKSLQLAFHEESEIFEAINNDWCSVQRNNAQRHYDRRVQSLQEQIVKLRFEGKSKGATLRERQIAKAEQVYRSTIKQIEQKSQVEPLNRILAGGVIFIE